MKALLSALLVAPLLMPASAFAAEASSAPATTIPDQPILVANPPAANPAPAALTPAPATQSATGPYADTIPVPAATPEEKGGFAGFFQNFYQDPDAYSITSIGHGLSTHKPMYLLPVTYSKDFSGNHTEVIFQISAKQKLFDTDFYIGYSQKSFWQLYNRKESSPFRETDYNPEIFYRWTPNVDWLNHWGTDVGFEHESNGRSLPESRSWNRVYFAPFQAKGQYLVYLKFWYRIPEKDKTSPTDAEGDDNPDIERFYGHAELQLQRQFFHNHLAHLTVKGNVNTGKGSVALNYSIPSGHGSVFYCLNFFSGYGESLIDYNHAITRIGIGVMVAR